MIQTVILVVCLMITLFSLGQYLVQDIHAREHRLLPVALCLTAVFQFFLIVDEVMDLNANPAFLILKQLLWFQVLVILFWYAMDFLRIHFRRWMMNLFFLAIISINLVMCFQISLGVSSKILMQIVVLLVFFVLFVVSTLYVWKKPFTQKERKRLFYLQVAILIPMLGLIYESFRDNPHNLFLSITLALSCLLMDHLMQLGQLSDDVSFLRENLFDTSEIPLFLFDENYHFLGANMMAKTHFAEYVSEVSQNPTGFKRRLELKEWYETGGLPIEWEIDGRFFEGKLKKVQLQKMNRGFILSIYDITEQKKAAHMAELENEHKSVFMAKMSHDLRSPLHAIIGGTETIMEKNEMTERAFHMVQNIHDAGENLLQIVNSILDFSKMEQGKLELSQEELDFELCMEQIAYNSLIYVKKKELKFSLEFLTEYPKKVFGDELRIREMIYNLISNGIKYTQKGEVRCEVSAMKLLDGQYKLTVSVIDTGCGIKPELLEVLFEEYVRLENNINIEGTGLGLSIVKQLSEMMGGSVRAISDGTNGSTFIVEWIAKACNEEVGKPHLINEGFLDIGVSRKSGLKTLQMHFPDAKVLVVDDMEVNRDLFSEMVSNWKMDVMMVENGESAVEVIQKQHFDIIFLDQMMPGMQGTETADVIRGYVNTPIVIMTADNSNRMRNEAKNHAIDGFLTKPVKASEVMEMLNQLLPETQKRYTVNVSASQNVIRTNEEKYQKTLGIFVRELESFERDMFELASKEDLSDFRVRVHGVKGICKQLGRKKLGAFAEVFEMAAIADHGKFIQDYLEIFHADLFIEINRTHQELEQYQTSSETKKEIVSVEEKRDAFEKCMEGFEQFRVDQIENAIEVLEKMSLDMAEVKMVEKLKQLGEELEYEEGSRLIKEYIASTL